VEVVDMVIQLFSVCVDHFHSHHTRSLTHSQRTLTHKLSHADKTHSHTKPQRQPFDGSLSFVWGTLYGPTMLSAKIVII
jgi:hypothetical protein